MEHHLEDWVRAIQAGSVGDVAMERPDWATRIDAGVAHVSEIVGKVWRTSSPASRSAPASTLCAGGFHGFDHGQGGAVVVAAGGGADRRADVRQCRGDHSCRRGAARKGAALGTCSPS